MALAVGFGLGAPWRSVRRPPSGPPDPDAAIFVMGAGEGQTVSAGRLAAWADMLGGAAVLAPVSGPTAGPMLTDPAGRVGYRIGAVATDVASVTGAGTWPNAWEAGLPGPTAEGITVYALVALDVPQGTFPAAYRQWLAAGGTATHHLAFQGNGPAVSATNPVGDNYATGAPATVPPLVQGVTTCIALRMSRGAPQFAMKIGGDPWQTSTAIRGQLAGPLRVTPGAPLLAWTFAGSVCVYGVAAWAAAHDDATAEDVRAYLEAIGT